jgi:hypothetical protein
MQTPPDPVLLRRLAPLAVALLLVPVVHVAARSAARVESPLALTSSDPQLVEAFSWAARQASAYAFEGDAVGPWIEAALPGREAFCMRDVAHQSMGGHALGLQPHLRNMMRRFAENISDARDWCSLWEIDRHNRPAHADYRNDGDFWYNLPANFDVLDACYRMFLWSGDPAYVTDPVLLHFYDRTVTDYVERWRLGLNQVMTRPRMMNQSPALDPDAKFTQSRGIPGYNEESDDFVAGLDLLATEYAGFHAYARIQEARSNFSAARTWLAKAADVKALVNGQWWDEKNGGFFDHLTTNHALAPRSAAAWNSAELYWPVAADGAHLRASLARLVDQIGRSRSGPIEEQSHHPEILYRYGVPDVAYDQIMDLSRADRARREYPEVSFSVVGAVVTGLMGVGVDPVSPGREAALVDYFANQFVMTLPQLTSKTAWAELRHLPVRANDLTVRHDGVTATVFTNNRGPAVVWRAAFSGRFDALVVNGTRVKATRLVLPPGREVSFARVVVAPGTSAKVEVPAVMPAAGR